MQSALDVENCGQIFFQPPPTPLQNVEDSVVPEIPNGLAGPAKEMGGVPHGVEHILEVGEVQLVTE